MAPRHEAIAPATRRAVPVLAVLAGLLVLAAVGSASQAHVDLSGRRPSYVLVDTVVSLVLVGLVAGAGLGIYLLFSQREYLARRRSAQPARRRLVSAVLPIALGAALLYARGLFRHGGHTGAHNSLTPTLPDHGATARAAYEPHFATLPVVLVLAVAVVAAASVYLAQRPSRNARGRPSERPSLTLSLAEVLADTLDDLRAEPDARRAVVAAYARLERTLGAFGLPRRAAEAPDEYLHRILVDLEVGSDSVRRLTRLFARAKFSQHDVDPMMKMEAIDLLETIRGDLGAAEGRSQAERQRGATAPQVAG